MTAPASGSPRHSLFERVLSGAAWVMAGRVLSVAALLVSSSLLSHRLSDAEFGAYVLATFLMPFFAVLTNLGSQEILLRDIRMRIVRGDLAGARQSVRSCLTICTACSLIVATILVGGFGALATTKPHWLALRSEMPWVAAWMFFQTMSQVASEGCRGAGRFGWSTALYTKSGGWACNALFAAAALALWGNDHQAKFRTVMIVQTIAAALPAIGGLAVLGGLLRDSAALAGAASSQAEREAADVHAEHAPPTISWMLRESWPLFVSYVVIIGIEQLDIFVVGLLATDANLADYGVAKRWLATINFAFVSLAPAITPFVAELYQRHDLPRLERLLQGAATIVAVPTIAISLLLFVFAGPAIEATFGPQRLGAVGALRIQLFAQVLLSLAGHSYLALSMTGHQRALMHCSLIVGAVYLAVGPLATYQWGTVGAGGAKSLATAARALAASLMVRRYLGIWTMASLSPAVIRETFQSTMQRGRRVLRRDGGAAPTE